MNSEEIERIRSIYEKRLEAEADSRYAYWRPANLLLVQRLEWDIAGALAQRGLLPLTDSRALDIGCGDGFWLRFLLRLGAFPSNLHGIDLLPDRAEQASLLSPAMHIINGDASALPYPDGYFNLVMQFTAFSSILNSSVKQQVAGEMMRVLQTDGVILWYDFIFNPANRDTRGIRKRELQSLFPGCSYRFQRVTLAPPLARGLARYSRLGCTLLDAIPFLRTHYLATISKK